MVHVTVADTPPEGTYDVPSTIVVNGAPIDHVYYNAQLVWGYTGASWTIVRQLVDKWTFTPTNITNATHDGVSPGDTDNSFHGTLNGTWSKTINQLGLTATRSHLLNLRASFPNWGTKDSTALYLTERLFNINISNHLNNTSPGSPFTITGRSVTLPAASGTNIVSQSTSYGGSITASGTISEYPSTSTLSTTGSLWCQRTANVQETLADPYIQVTAVFVEWKKYAPAAYYASAGACRWQVKIKWASNELCDLTGAIITFVTWGQMTFHITDNAGSNSGTYTLGSSEGEKTLTGWAYGGIDSGYTDVGTPAAAWWCKSQWGWIAARCESTLRFQVSNLPANAVGGSASFSKQTRFYDIGYEWPSNEWFGRVSPNETKTVLIKQKNTMVEKVHVRIRDFGIGTSSVPSTVQIGSIIRVIGDGAGYEVLFNLIIQSSSPATLTGYNITGESKTAHYVLFILGYDENKQLIRGYQDAEYLGRKAQSITILNNTDWSTVGNISGAIVSSYSTTPLTADVSYYRIKLSLMQSSDGDISKAYTKARFVTDYQELTGDLSTLVDVPIISNIRIKEGWSDFQ